MLFCGNYRNKAKYKKKEKAKKNERCLEKSQLGLHRKKKKERKELVCDAIDKEVPMTPFFSVPDLNFSAGADSSSYTI